MYDAVMNLLQRVDPTVFTVILLAFAFAFGTAIISSIICQIGKFHKREQELAFRREMLLRGVPAEEIERVLAIPIAASTTCKHCDTENAPVRETAVYEKATYENTPYQPAQ